MRPMVTVTCSSLASVIWEPSPGTDLRDGVVQVWRASLRPQKAAWDNYFQELLPEEKQRALRFFRTEDRNRFLLGRKMLRSLTGYYFKIPPETIEFKTDSGGKPFLFCPAEKPLFFNLSHAGNWVLLTIGFDQSGVDVEAINPAIEIEDLSGACFSPQEQQVIQKEASPVQAFYTFWTRKEALLKATGIGLIDQLTHFSCLDGTNSTGSDVIRSGKDWLIRSFPVDNDHVGSVAVAPGPGLAFLDFDLFRSLHPEPGPRSL